MHWLFKKMGLCCFAATDYRKSSVKRLAVICLMLLALIGGSVLSVGWMLGQPVQKKRASAVVQQVMPPRMPN
jgi:hypothetical protein